MTPRWLCGGLAEGEALLLEHRCRSLEARPHTSARPYPSLLPLSAKRLVPSVGFRIGSVVLC